jgi:hypothetical protein
VLLGGARGREEDGEEEDGDEHDEVGGWVVHTFYRLNDSLTCIYQPHHQETPSKRAKI